MSSAGRMRCLAALARWVELNNLCKEYWTPAEPSARLEMAPMVVSDFCTVDKYPCSYAYICMWLGKAANAAWNMGEWDQMAEYVSRLDDGDETKLRGLGNTAASGDGSSSGTFFRAVLLVRRGKVFCVTCVEFILFLLCLLLCTVLLYYLLSWFLKV